MKDLSNISITAYIIPCWEANEQMQNVSMYVKSKPAAPAGYRSDQLTDNRTLSSQRLSIHSHTSLRGQHQGRQPGGQNLGSGIVDRVAAPAKSEV